MASSRENVGGARSGTAALGARCAARSTPRAQDARRSAQAQEAHEASDFQDLGDDAEISEDSCSQNSAELAALAGDGLQETQSDTDRRMSQEFGEMEDSDDASLSPNPKKSSSLGFDCQSLDVPLSGLAQDSRNPPGSRLSQSWQGSRLSQSCRPTVPRRARPGGATLKVNHAKAGLEKLPCEGCHKLPDSDCVTRISWFQLQCRPSRLTIVSVGVSLGMSNHSSRMSNP